MPNQNFKISPLFSAINSTLIYLPVPKNISMFWNIGSLLSICLFSQIATGLFLSSGFTPHIDLRFNITSNSIESIELIWLTRYIHANGGSLFFILLYSHMARGMYYNSFLYRHVWYVGVSILLMSIATAFLGYVLPINQISYWGASVITRLFSEIPYLGPDLVKLIWGGSFVDTPTITRFFTFHFVLPFVILAFVVVHIAFLHTTGSSNPLGLTLKLKKTPFHPHFSFKDTFGIILVFSLFILLCMYFPLSLGDDDNFVIADLNTTPIHIQPEWYFLFAYAILRSIPNKLGGVIALLLSVLIFYVIPLIYTSKLKRFKFYPFNKIFFWLFLFIVVLLSWVGLSPVEEPFVVFGQTLAFMYFAYFYSSPLLALLWDKIKK